CLAISAAAAAVISISRLPGAAAVAAGTEAAVAGAAGADGVTVAVMVGFLASSRWLASRFLRARRGGAGALRLPAGCRHRGIRLGRLLLLVVLDRGLDRVLGEDRAVDLDRREVQLLDDLRVLDLRGLIEGHALDHLGRQRRRGDRRAT